MPTSGTPGAGANAALGGPAEPALGSAAIPGLAGLADPVAGGRTAAAGAAGGGAGLGCAAAREIWSGPIAGAVEAGLPACVGFGIRTEERRSHC
ncbi:hypothetical protein MKUB_44920 [Mycobacterium kubicae]|uniref:Uncharacterized protein n=1 Tax=Mycobacterium kubicae TaxID=120959 RepID=A0ABQ1BTE3_9MYCO|nr:hypothetical protein MKUB_44920 [Mycobacterium kubicae]